MAQRGFHITAFSQGPFLWLLRMLMLTLLVADASGAPDQQGSKLLACSVSKLTNLRHDSRLPCYLGLSASISPRVSHSSLLKDSPYGPHRQLTRAFLRRLKAPASDC